jgi:sugar diacid utilization regulator
LKEYKVIENRKVNIWNSKEVDKELEKLFVLLKAKKKKEAKTQLGNVFNALADLADSNW